MSFPEIIDFDRIVNVALEEIGKSISNWLKGRPTDEVALMNHITGNFNRNRRGCDVGVQDPITMTSQVALLHRKGQNQTDLYGADLAVTISIEGFYTKTVLFQLKKSRNYKAVLETRQFHDSLSHPLAGPRSFVLVADEERYGLRISSVSDLARIINNDQQTLTVDCSMWSGITQWLWEWLSCNAAPPSDLSNGPSIEALLQQFVVDEPSWVSPWGRDSAADLQVNFPLVRAWLVMFFYNANLQNPKENIIV